MLQQNQLVAMQYFLFKVTPKESSDNIENKVEDTVDLAVDL